MNMNRVHVMMVPVKIKIHGMRKGRVFRIWLLVTIQVCCEYFGQSMKNRRSRTQMFERVLSPHFFPVHILMSDSICITFLARAPGLIINVT